MTLISFCRNLVPQKQNVSGDRVKFRAYINSDKEEVEHVWIVSERKIEVGLKHFQEDDLVQFHLNIIVSISLRPWLVKND